MKKINEIKKHSSSWKDPIAVEVLFHKMWVLEGQLVSEYL